MRWMRPRSAGWPVGFAPDARRWPLSGRCRRSNPTSAWHSGSRPDDAGGPMAFFLLERDEPRVEGAHVFLRPPIRRDWRLWAELRTVSRDFLVPWEPTWPSDALTRAAFRRRLDRQSEEWERDTAYCFFIFRRADDALIGGINLNNVRRGVAQMASLGYWIGKPYAQRGYMTEAV